MATATEVLQIETFVTAPVVNDAPPVATPKPRGGKKASPERVEEVRKLSQQFPQHEVARRLGYRSKGLSKFYKRHGIPSLRFPKPPKPEPPPKPAEKVCIIKITAQMRKCANQAGIEVGQYLVELFQADAAERNFKEKPEALSWKAEPVIKMETKGRVRVSAGEVTQTVLHLLSSDEFERPRNSIPALRRQPN